MTGIIRPFRGLMPRIADDVFIAETAVIIGDVEIAPGASIWYGCILRGDINRIRIGRNTNIQDGTIIHCNHDPAGDYRETGGGEPTLIGDGVTVGHLALLHACTVEDGGFVGMRAAVLDRAVVESGAMVAAGALVAPGKRIPAGQLWAGNPARYLREVRDQERHYITYIPEHYTELAGEYRQTKAAAE